MEEDCDNKSWYACGWMLETGLDKIIEFYSALNI